ncbi:universal stress protein [Haloferax sulfurifontis]|uniref:UspA domain-containing protein n=2 Tax=Haloferax sulfurifontis TaxID=255616 RepID=M0I8T3_9EURY|nr:universal stress protein [Haloferax sulfurifontis]ELZ93225.1 UspA domain-containing protein [Haloferax sulfurifontis ATCC BAA-897]GGC53339.1 universal stress protein UspA [Haloferax sulfurifontis]
MAIETILLAIGAGDADRIDRLAEETIDVAGPTGATVVIGHVFTRDEYDDALDNLDFDITAEEVSADDVARRHATVRELTRRFDDADLDYVVHGRVGHHGEKLVELAGEVDADRLVVGGRKRSPAGKAVFGSVAQEVMLEAPCPVTFVRADTK